jgi:hypothetical protein
VEGGCRAGAPCVAAADRHVGPRNDVDVFFMLMQLEELGLIGADPSSSSPLFIKLATRPAAGLGCFVAQPPGDGVPPAARTHSGGSSL